MDRSHLKRVAATDHVHAEIISDGCRDYLVHIVAGAGAGLLQQRGGQPMRFGNLREARALLSACRVRSMSLRQRVAHDEACALPPGSNGFADMPLSLAD